MNPCECKPTARAPATSGASAEPEPARALSFVFAAIGMTPISALALSLLEIVPLHVGGPLFVGSAVTLAATIWVRGAANGLPLWKGLRSGLIAVLLYDCTRLPLILLGGWPDFIPKIGIWLLHTPDAHWSVGYLWRYLGNGAGMGLAFTMVFPIVHRRIGPRVAGVLFGTLIWTGLLITLLLAPNGQEKMFQLSSTTLVASLTGHLVYGAVLGHRVQPVAPSAGGASLG